MPIADKLLAARKKKGLTQEELAERTNITVRTIQRIENSETTPRPHTLRTIAAALDLSWEELTAPEVQPHIATLLPTQAAPAQSLEDGREFLQTICLSCFTYLVIPYVHFLVPAYLLKRKRVTDPAVAATARRIIRGQAYWVIALNALLLLTLAYNLACTSLGKRQYSVGFLLPVFVLYGLNAGIIARHLWRIRRATPAGPLI